MCLVLKIGPKSAYWTTAPAITHLFPVQVFLWNMDDYSLVRKLEGHHNDVVSCEFSPDGALLVTASYDTRVIVWDPYKGTILLEQGWDVSIYFEEYQSLVWPEHH